MTASTAYKPVWNGSTTYTSTYSYDALGNLTSVAIADGRPRTVSFIDTLDGEVLQRDEADGNGSTGDPRELHYYFDGMAVGDISNNGTSDVDYAASIAEHIKVPGTGPFRDGATSSTSYANFDQSYDPINGLTYQNAPTSYTVQAGDTLQSIAYRLWGDSSFWYLIADANGMTSDQTLVAGQDLVIPDKVHNVHNNADTFQVYDPNKAQGAHIPTPPKPQPQDDGGCGVFGTILLVVIAIVVSVVTAGAALAAIAPGISTIGAGMGSFLGLAGSVSVSLGDLVIAGAIGGAMGSLVSQGVGLATGLQSKFSWAGVAEAAIGGGIGAGLGGISGLSGGGVLGAVGRGLAGDVLTQGIGVATGLQKSFNWAEVAAAGVAAGVGYEVGDALGIEPVADGKGGYTYSGPATDSLDYAWRAGVSGIAGSIAGAATRSVISGTDFGDNLMAMLPSTIGNTIGNMVAGGIAGYGASADDVMAQVQEHANANAAEGWATILQQADAEIAFADASAIAGTSNTNSLTLQERISLLDAALPAATDGIDSASESSYIDAQQRTILSRASNLVNYGNVEISFVGPLDEQAAGNSYVSNGKGFINIDASQDEYFNPDGTVNMEALEATLVHESTHISNYLAWGHGPETQGQLRQTERNAFSAEADFYQAIKVTPPTYLGLTANGRVSLQLTAENVKAIAEYDVKTEYPRLYQVFLANHNSMVIYDAKVKNYNANSVYLPIPLKPIPPRPTPYALPRDLGGN